MSSIMKNRISRFYNLEMHGLKVSGSMVLDDLRPYRYHKIRYKTVHCSIDLHCDALRRIHYRTTKQVEQHVHSLVFE